MYRTVAASVVIVNRRVWGEVNPPTRMLKINIINSVPDPNPDPPDPHVFGPPGSGSTSQRYGSGSGSFYHHAKIVRITLIPTIL
jgi:hypothetical protein